jgi:diguanylate cyclase (GGDEF)-like protein
MRRINAIAFVGCLYLVCSIAAAQLLLLAGVGMPLRVVMALVGGIAIAFGVFCWARSLRRELRESIDAYAASLRRGDEGPPPSMPQDDYAGIGASVQRVLVELSRQRDGALRQAWFDTLTGLPNRPNLRREVAARLEGRDGRPFTVALFDLDGFKRVNDSFGHDAGDRLLVSFVARAREVLAGWPGPGAARPALLARLGGDEFAMVIDCGEDSAQAERLVQAILDATLEPYDDVKRDLVVRASAGTARYPTDGDRVERLLKCADTAMYAAKVSAKGTQRRFEAEMLRDAMQRVTLERELRAALRDGRIRVAYQPVCDLVSGAVIGAEALARWSSDALGEVAPSDFIPVAEANGMLDELCFAVLDQVLGDLATPGLPAGFRVGINVSASQLRTGVFLDAVVDRLRRAPGLPMVAIEITESSKLIDAAAAAQAVECLRSAGVPVWLDDFGTGFSALSHLNTLAPDGVKIDREFVGRLGSDGDSGVIEAVLAIARSLDLDVIAEGIEDAATAQQLATIGITKAQGFWLGRPQSWTALVNRLPVGTRAGRELRPRVLAQA